MPSILQDFSTSRELLWMHVTFIQKSEWAGVINSIIMKYCISCPKEH